MRFKAIAALAILSLASTVPAFGQTKIGVITSLTGSLAAFGEAHKNGYAIALDEINAKGGVLGKKIELDFYDDQSKPDQAVQGVSKLIDQDQVPVLLGSYSSESTKAIVPAVSQRETPLIIPTATADNVMDSKSPWIFRVCAGATDYAKATIAFLKANGAPKKMAIIYENTNFGQSNMKAMTAAAKEAGIELVAVESYEAKSPDYKAVLQRVKQANPDVIYFCSYLLDATTLMRQSREVDLNPRFYTSAGTGFAPRNFPRKKAQAKMPNTLSLFPSGCRKQNGRAQKSLTPNISSASRLIRLTMPSRLMLRCALPLRPSTMPNLWSRPRFATPSRTSTCLPLRLVPSSLITDKTSIRS